MAPAALTAPVAGQGSAQQAQTQSTTVADGIVVGSGGADIQRSVTATYTVPHGQFLQSFQALTARTVQLGGFVVSSQTEPDRTGRIVSGSLTVKIPASQLAVFLNGFPSTFATSAINFSSIDHTADFIDVNARLASANAHLIALQKLLADATSLDDITMLEQQIEQVQQEIDQDQGQLDLLTNDVTYATATIALSERGTVSVASPAPAPIAGGIGSGWSNAGVVTGALLEGVVSALPLIVLGMGAGLVWMWLRRRPVRAA
ncbi:MAG: DUF4349 domain-containing protein [Candidatus Dormibacteraeota bacterium]|nr:DUF4349 domain-containing protein [Candidatus Dormibacteraeota bacterium]